MNDQRLASWLTLAVVCAIAYYTTPGGFLWVVNALVCLYAATIFEICDSLKRRRMAKR